MIYTLTRDINTAMRARNWPFIVSYGPERTTNTTPVGNANRIVIQRDRTTQEQFGAPRGLNKNPSMRMMRGIACEALVYGQSTLTGAGVHDHEAVVDQHLDLLISELSKWATAARTIPISFDSGRMLPPGEMNQEGIETWASVAYRLAFTVDRGILDKDYTGAATPTGNIDGGFNNSTTIQFPTGTPESAC